MSAIVVVARGLPAGWVGAYGNEWVGTPHLDRLAAEGVAFDRHLSDCPDPDAAGRAWLTGRHQLPPIGDSSHEPSTDPRPVLLDALSTSGVRTVLVRANHPDTDAPPPFYAGWGEVFDARPEADDASPLDALLLALPDVLDRLPADRQWLLWIETDRLVPPWDVPQEVFEAYLEDEDDGEKPPDSEPVPPFADPPTGPFDRSDPAALDFLHRTFAAVVTKFDAELGWMVELFRERGLDRTAAWLVTSDRGYPLGEHGQVGPHRPWLHQSVVQLPLLLRLPDAAEAGRRAWAFTQPADLAPTLLSLCGASTPAEHGHGFDLLPLARGGEAVRRYACSGWVVNAVGEWAIHAPAHTLLLPGPQPEGEPERPPRLYEKPEDRWEANDLRVRLLEEADRLEAVLREYVAAVQQPGPLVAPPLADGHPSEPGA